MKKKKPKTADEIAIRNLTRNLSTKNKKSDRTKAGMRVIDCEKSTFISGHKGNSLCKNIGLIAHKTNNKTNSASKAFSKEENVVIIKYKDGILSKEDANIELERIAKLKKKD